MIDNDKRPYNERFQTLITERESFVAHYRELSEYIAPERGRFDDTKTNKGTRKDQSILDNKAGTSLGVLASGLMSGLTSPAYPWFRFKLSDDALNDNADVRSWLYACQSRMQDVFARSNFYRALPTFYKELGLFGTACMIIDKSFENVINCHVLTAGTYCVANDSEYRANVLYRKFSMTVSQLMEKKEQDGWDISPRIQQKHDMGKLDEWIDIIHVIEPNDQRESGKIDKKNKKYRSLYFEEGKEAEGFLSVSGYDDCPFVCVRWETVGEDVYGIDAPAMMALGDVRQLQKMTLDKLEAIRKAVRPPLVGPASLAGSKVDTSPDGITLADESMAQGGLRPIYEMRLDLPSLMNDIALVKERIATVFYENLFMMLAQTDRRQITAREVAERHEEKLLMLGPVLVRLHDEFLSPAIERVFGIMFEGGLFDEAPEELAGRDINIEFVSLLAQAQKAVAVSSIEDMTMFTAQMAQLDPSALDKLNIYAVIDARADALGVPPVFIRTDEEAAVIAQARAQQQQQQQQMAQMAQMASVAKDAGSAADTRLPEMLRGIVGNA